MDQKEYNYVRSLIEASLDPIVTINSKGKITDVNEASIKITGVLRDKLIGTNFSTYFTDPKKAEEGYELAFKAGSVKDYPLTIRHINGELSDVLYHASIYKDSEGKALGIYATARDVTDQKWAKELRKANKELNFQNSEKEKRASELTLANKELAFQNNEKEKRASELTIANEELAFQNNEKEKRAAELFIANKELVFQNSEKEKRASELTIANEELAYQNTEKEKRAAELFIANKELVFQNSEKEKRASELTNVNQELAFQNIEKENRAAELKIANKELAFQNNEKEKRAEELILANKELLYQNGEKEKRAAELLIANRKLVFETEEKEKRAAELVIADIELAFQNKEKVKQEIVNNELRAFSSSAQLASEYSLSLIEASHDPLITIDLDGKITDMNQATVDRTGIEREKLKGTNFQHYFTEPSKAKKVYEEVFDKGLIADALLTMRHQNGKLIEMLFNGSVYTNDEGKVLGIVIVARDVTAQHRASQYARSLIEASRDPLFTVSPDGIITDINKASEEVTGVTRDKMIGSLFINYFTEPKKAKKGYQEIFTKGFVRNFPVIIKDDNLTDILFNGSVYKDEVGRVIGAVIIARDITEQKRVEKELTEAKVFAELATEFADEAKGKAEKATEIAVEAVKAKQQFLSNMSHEIRTPMNAIIGFTKVLLKTNLSRQQTEYLSAIKISGDALIVLINDILDLAKVDSGKMSIEQTPFKLAASLASMLHLFEPKIQEKNLILKTSYDNQIPDVLVGDPVRLHQIILNLVSNAVKFTSHGTISIDVRLKTEDEHQATIIFSVSDSGIGIPQDKIETIFENFQQASSGTSRLYGGTGLGLAIVKQLVTIQGGSINVKSEQGKGSTFSFTLNFSKTKADIELEDQQVYLDPEIKNIKVLVVEDIPLNQLLMKTLLDEFGFERDVASNGLIAIEKLRLKSFDIVLMDLQMPEMNGFEATTYIRNTLNSKIPIIALTADVTTVDLAKCKAVGMNDYIAKPVDEKILYSKIVGLVKKPISLGEIEVLITNSNSDFPKTKYIDLSYLDKRTKSNPILMIEMIGLYLEQTPPLIATMKQSFLNEDWESLHSAVHKMIPSFSIMGIHGDFEDKAKKIQEFAFNKTKASGIHELVTELELVCLEACKELTEEITRIQSTKL